MKISYALPTLIALGFASPVLAQSAGDWTIGVGAIWINPKDDNGTLAGMDADIDDDARPSVTVEYFIRDNLGIELVLATPFKHDVKLDGVYGASTKHLPPTVSLIYHFDASPQIRPFLGAGLNYTTFFSEKSPLGDISLDESWGAAVMGGLDFMIDDQNAIRAEVRWIDIDSDVTLDGVDIGTANIDPVVAAMYWVHRF